MIEEAFKELGARWKPLLDVLQDNGVKIGFELHPGEDTFDGTTFEMFLEQTGNHPACGINYDPSTLPAAADGLCRIHPHLPRTHLRLPREGRRVQPDSGQVRAFTPVSRTGRNAPAASARLGDGQVDFSSIFSALAQHNYDSWAVLEWECCLKDSTQGAIEGAPFIESHIIKTTAKAFDDFAAGSTDTGKARRMLGLK